MQIENEIIVRMTTDQAAALRKILAAITADEMCALGMDKEAAADMIQLYHQLPIAGSG